MENVQIFEKKDCYLHPKKNGQHYYIVLQPIMCKNEWLDIIYAIGQTILKRQDFFFYENPIIKSEIQTHWNFMDHFLKYF